MSNFILAHFTSVLQFFLVVVPVMIGFYGIVIIVLIRL